MERYKEDNMKQKQQKGFTLLEILIVVVIVAILAAVAVPSYQNYVLRSQRADGMAALQSLQLALEKFRGSCATYPDTLAGADDCAAGEIAFGNTSTDNHYNISIASATGNSFQIEADPTGRQADDTGCDPMVITVNNANPKGLKTPADCWN
jgi:type IV pilus assembly protein PilE